ncbi:MAG: aminotransferase class I/II-fold pyridoxal phosphate-dependent enzyme [Candidatus Limnocylindrales bacterium]
MAIAEPSVPSVSSAASSAASSSASSAPTPGLDAWVARGQLAAARDAAARAKARTRRFDTIAVHGLYDHLAAADNQGSLIEPAYLSPAQHFADSDHLEAALGYLIPAWGYTRLANPTTHYLEETLALLETYGTDLEASALVTGSGMAAVHLATNALIARDPARPTAVPNIVASARCYGGTFMLFMRYAEERGIGVRWIQDPLDTAAWATAIDDDTRCLYVEVPSNPALSLADVPALAALAHDHGMPLLVDSTVATPALFRPLALGADVVIHSLSKAIGSSGLAIAGAVIASRDIPVRVGSDELRADFAMQVKLLPSRDLGPALSPWSALALISDLRTLRTRMDAWSRGAMTVARFLEAHPAVASVGYPGLESHPGHAIAARDFSLADGDADGAPAVRYGTLMAFTLAGGLPAARRAYDRFELVFRATDLGRVKSVATIPSISTHQQQGEAGRAVADIAPGLIRLSVGGEHPDDVIADLAQALEG